MPSHLEAIRSSREKKRDFTPFILSGWLCTGEKDRLTATTIIISWKQNFIMTLENYFSLT